MRFAWANGSVNGMCRSPMAFTFVQVAYVFIRRIEGRICTKANMHTPVGSCWENLQLFI